MDFRLFDSHCHLYMPQFDADRDAVIARMREAGMGALVIGADFKTSKQAVESVKPHDFLWAAVGLHPNDNPTEIFNIAAYEELARDPKVVAIGECGLEYSRDGSVTEEEKTVQMSRFKQQIELAQKINNALIIHCRNAHDDCSSVLQNTGIAQKVPVVVHFFTGTAELAQKYLDLGCYLSFPGPITYTDMYDESIKICPLDKMLIETDAPFAAPVPNRGKRNEPIYVADVARKIAVLKGLTYEQVAEATAKNASSVFLV